MIASRPFPQILFCSRWLQLNETLLPIVSPKTKKGSFLLTSFDPDVLTGLTDDARFGANKLYGLLFFEPITQLKGRDPVKYFNGHRLQ